MFQAHTPFARVRPERPGSPHGRDRFHTDAVETAPRPAAACWPALGCDIGQPASAQQSHY